MHAAPGSQIIITGHHVGEPDRTGEVLEVRGPGGAPPFLVRWDDSGHESLLFPGSDCVIRDLHHEAGPVKKQAKKQPKKQAKKQAKKQEVSS